MKNKSVKNTACFGDDPILHSAWLYYQDGLNQSEIARVLGVSRASVIKYLQQAREQGYVQINLDHKRYTSVDKALQIQNKYGLDNVLILPSDDDSAPLRSRLAQAGAMYLNRVVQDDDVVGIAWGRTIHELSLSMAPKPLSNVTVMQMLGSMYSPSGFAAEECSSYLAHKFSGKCLNLHVPAVVSSARLATELQAEPIIRAQFATLERCNRAIFVVGGCDADNSMVRTGILTAEEMQKYHELGAVGVICGRFFDEEGQPVVTELDLRILGVSLAQLRQVEQRIFLGGGQRNHTAIYAAILGGYVSDLITDETTAEFLLAQPDPGTY